MTIGCGIGGGDTEAGGFSGEYPTLSGSSAPSASAGKAYLFLDTENDNVLTMVDESGTLFRIDEFIDTAQATLADLETNYPAASHSSYFAWVAGTTAENGLYQSNNTSWVKLLDNSGDRTTLWDYAAGLSYSGTDDISTAAGTVTWYKSDLIGTLPINPSGPVGNAFDNNDSTRTWTQSALNSEVNGSYLVKELTSGTIKLGKLKYVADSSTLGATVAQQVSAVGLTGGTWEVLNILSHTGDGSLSGNVVTGLGVDGDEFEITVSGGEYEGYGWKLFHSSATQLTVNTFRGEIVTDLSASIDCVGSTNKLYNGAGRITSSDITTATTLDETYGTIPVDASGGAVTITLPALADSSIPSGKIYTIIKTDSSTNAVTIDGDGSETINGATTYVLASQNSKVTVQEAASEWLIISSDPSTEDIFPVDYTAATTSETPLTLSAAASATPTVDIVQFYGRGASLGGVITDVGAFSNQQGVTNAESYGKGTTVTGLNSVAGGYGLNLAGADSIAWGSAITSSVAGTKATGIGRAFALNYDSCIGIGYGAAPAAASQLQVGSTTAPITGVCFSSGTETVQWCNPMEFTGSVQAEGSLIVANGAVNVTLTATAGGEIILQSTTNGKFQFKNASSNYFTHDSRYTHVNPKNDGIYQVNDAIYGWSSASLNNTTASADTALARSSAGIVKITNGGSGLGGLECATLDVGDTSSFTKYIDIKGMAAPSVSNSGEARIYFDSTANKLKISENGGAYVNLV